MLVYLFVFPVGKGGGFTQGNGLTEAKISSYLKEVSGLAGGDDSVHRQNLSLTEAKINYLGHLALEFLE